MGQSTSTERQEISAEEASHELALRFAEKCFSHLEIAHYKDNFKTLADHQDGIEYWKEETLCRFLSIPNLPHAGPVLFQIATYLGSFPFPSLAPCILTREAMLKVVTIMTERYKKVLKRGSRDKNKLLFRSMAVFDRRMSLSPTMGKKSPFSPTPVSPDVVGQGDASLHPSGFAIDQPAHDDEEEEDDDLALAALDALDAFEVFQEDQKRERKINQAHIPAHNLGRLLELILLFSPVTAQDNLAAFSQSLDSRKRQILSESADAMVAAFHPEQPGNGIRYNEFVQTLTITMPYLFRPLNLLFEHFLFSKNINLSKHTDPDPDPGQPGGPCQESPIYRESDDPEPDILNDILLAQLATSLEIFATPRSSQSSIFHSGARFNQLYSTSSHGTSLSSFSRQVLAWHSASLFLVIGSDRVSGQRITIGAHLPKRWKDNNTGGAGGPEQPVSAEHLPTAAMFQLHPTHAIFRANPFNKTTSLSHFSSKTGISLGCVVPPSSRIQAAYQKPVLGPVSLLIDEDISTATFQHDPEAGTGAFLTDPRLEERQKLAAESGSQVSQPKKLEFDIEALEVWGISSPTDVEDSIEAQKKRLAWEEAEAERRRGVAFGGDKDGARHLLEMAGIVGENAANRSGGSV